MKILNELIYLNADHHLDDNLEEAKTTSNIDY